MKTIVNRRFLIGLIIGSLLLGAAVHGLHAVQINRQSRFLLEEAHRAQKDKQFELAVNRFQQYAKLAPDDVDAQAEFGLLLADHGASREAAVTLEKVLRAQPDRDDLRRRLATLEMAIGRWSDAKAHLERLLAKESARAGQGGQSPFVPKTAHDGTGANAEQKGTVPSPGDAALWDLLGTCQAAGGEYATAAASLQKSITGDPHQVDTYAHLAEVLRQLKRPDEADAWMEKLVQANPDSARAHLLDGQYLAGIGHAEEARSQVEKALELAPKETDALLLAARLALAEQGAKDGVGNGLRAVPGVERGANGSDGASSTARNGTEAVPYSPLSRARDYARRAIESAPASAAGYIALARIEATGGDRKKAIACLATGAEKTQSHDPGLLWELGRLRIETGDLTGAQEVVDTLHKFPANDRFEPLIGYLEAQVELANHHWQAAIQQLEQVAPQLIGSDDLLKLQMQVRFQLAACHEKLGNTELQLAAYREAASVDPTWPPARLGIASTLLALGKFDEALEEYRQIAKLSGMEGAGTVGEARLLILKNLARGPVEQDWKEVDGLLDQLGRSNPDSVGVTLLRAEALVGEQHPIEAEKLLQAARTKSPERVELWTALAGLANRQQQWTQTEKLLDEADKKFGDQVWLRLTRGSYLLARFKQDSTAGQGGQSPIARKTAQKGTVPEQKGTVSAAISSKLKALGDTTESFSPADRVNLARGLASLSLEAGDAAQATALARRACDADAKNLEARLFLFDLAMNNGDRVNAEQVLKEVRDLEGEGPFWHFGQAALCMLDEGPAAGQQAGPGGQSPFATKISQKGTVPEQKGTVPDAAFRRASVGALEHIATARKLRPGWSTLSLLTARIQDRLGQSGPALQNYLEAIDLGERSPAAVRRAVELLYAQQRYSEADQLLRKLQQQPALFSSDVERMASKVSARLEDVDRALELARKVAADSRDWQDHVWLGQLESLQGLRAKSAGQAAEASSRLAEAEKSLRLAVQLKPEASEPWVALIRFYAATDRKADAETTIRQAQRSLPDKTAAAQALATSYEAIGNVDEAAKQYQSALANSAQDALVVRSAAEFEWRHGKLADAEAHLRMIVSGNVPAKPEEVASARRELAAVLRASGSYPKIQEALALVEQNLAAEKSPATGASAPNDSGEKAMDLREKAFALALSPQPERREEAIEILEKLLPAQGNADDLRIALVQLYLGEKDWPRASKLLRSLVTSHEKDPRYMAVYVARLLERQETDEAELWIRRLEELAPNDFATANLKAEALIQRGQVDPAIQVLRDALARPGLSAADAVGQTRVAAARLEELAGKQPVGNGLRAVPGSAEQPVGKSAAADAIPGSENQAADGAAKLLAEAERLYRKFVKEQPDQQLVLVTFLARRGRYDEALTLAETAQPAADPKALAQACVELMGSGLDWTGPGQRLEKLMLAAIEQHGHAAVLLIALADLRMRQERLDDAAVIYREILEKEPTSVVAMNNLAMLLALEKKQLDQAERLVDQAIAAAGPLPALLDSRASVYLALGRPREALADLEQAIAAEPRPNRQFHRALACYQLGQTAAAAQALGEARKLGLKPEDLNPLERHAYRKLSEELRAKG